MGLADTGTVIIEVGCNEFTTKDQNPHVPYGADEVAADVIACARAGAAVAHFHARGDDGEQDWAGADRYERAMTLIAAGCDIVSYPSYFRDHSHIWELAARAPGGAAAILASYDVPQEVVGPRLWNEARQAFEDPPFDTVGGAAPPDPLAEMARRGVRPTVNVFDVGEARWLALAIRARMFSTPLYVKLFLCEQLVNGPFADARGIDAYLSQFRDDMDLECVIVPYTMMDAARADDLLRAALGRRLHVRVGIGDNPYAYPTRSNADLVARAVDLVVEAGLTPATPAEVRERLGVAPFTG